MDWVKKQTNEYEMFWHVTPRENIESIMKQGLKQSIIGIYGDGVYCIPRNEYDPSDLINVVNFFEKNNFKRESLVVIEFEYLGEYFINQTRPMFEENGWIVIPSDIPVKLIDNIRELEEII